MALPLDFTGALSTNWVPNETHVASVAYVNQYNTVFLNEGGFFSTGLVVTYLPVGGVSRTLILGCDYVLVYQLPNIKLDGLLIYGAIALLDTSLHGDIAISYQAFGGKWLFDYGQINGYLLEHYLNPKNDYAALVPSPAFYPEPTQVNLETKSNIEASLALMGVIRLGVVHKSLVTLKPVASATDAAEATLLTTMASTLGLVSDPAYSGSGDGTVAAMLKKIALITPGGTGGNGATQVPIKRYIVQRVMPITQPPAGFTYVQELPDPNRVGGVYVLIAMTTHLLNQVSSVVVMNGTNEIYTNVVIDSLVNIRIESNLSLDGFIIKLA